MASNKNENKHSNNSKQTNSNKNIIRKYPGKDLKHHPNSSEKNTSALGREWKFRSPPRGLDAYVLCENFEDSEVCSYSNQCIEAHGVEELAEWNERFEYRKIKMEKAHDKELVGKTYTEQLLEKWALASSPDKIMKEKLECVEEACSNEPLVTTVSSKVSKRDWTFVLKAKRLLKAVALIQDGHRSHFSIKGVFPAGPKLNASGQVEGNKVVEAKLTSDQEWVAPEFIKYAETTSADGPLFENFIYVGFTTDIYGTFRQSVVFDFGSEPVLVKHLCIDVVPVSEYDKIQEIRNNILLSTKERWNESNSNIIPYVQAGPTYSIHPTSSTDEIIEAKLIESYPCPNASTFILTQSTITEKKLTKHNYRSRMHELLFIEEIARYEQIARFNLNTKLKVTNTFILAPNGMATSTAKYSHSGELFALLELSEDISEDTSAGRLILNSCSTIYLSSSGKEAVDKINVYESMIEDKSKNMIYLKLSADTVTTLNLKHDDEVTVEIQFQPNRLAYCEWHLAVDKISDYRLIFPETYIDPEVPWNPKLQWDGALDSKLNSKQREAVLTITSPLNIHLPPILLIGPFGTGKTFCLAQVIKKLLLQDDARILVCTHSNSAADLYIKEYLHPWVEDGMEEAKPLRVYYHKRWVATTHPIVQKYCLIELKGNFRIFKRPTVEDVMSHKIVVVTLSTSMELAALGLKKGYFTHILLDEAAQALECEAIMPLALADEKTRIVLAGDHMQMSPEIFSNFARERKLHISLLERLYNHYPANFPTKILLCENYRAHEAIIKFTSELFYDQKLIASGKQPRHDKFYPLTFFTTRGEDIQDKNSTAFYNNSEVYEVVERVCELRKKWPTVWGKFNELSIGIVTPYSDQVFRIRSELRKRRMPGISVERVLNVQGKQFRAVFLSTVRTRKTCNNKQENVDFGFLSNSKLLNTAITRAQSLVSVVGDPVALCSVGRCRKVWERFIETCHQNKSLFGITWSSLKAQLDGVELRKTYVLNPLAPEFVPRALQTESYLRDQIASKHLLMMPQQSLSSQSLPKMQHTHQMHSNHIYQSSMHPMLPTNTHNKMFRPIGSPSYSIPPQQSHVTSNNSMNQPPFQVPPFSNNNNNIFNYNPQQPPPQSQQQMLHHQSGHNFPISSGGMNASNLWNSTNTLFPSLPPLSESVFKNQSMAWHTKTMPQQSSPHQIRGSLQQQQIPTASSHILGNMQQHNQMFTSPPLQQQQQLPNLPVYMHQQQQMGVYQHKKHHMELFNGNNISSEITPMANVKIPAGNCESGELTCDHLLRDKESVQFLHNVHFPEKVYTFNQHQTIPNISGSHSHLLPPNMSLHDVLMEPKEFQNSWYKRLIETYGLEEAGKFIEMIKHATTFASSTNDIKIFNPDGSVRLFNTISDSVGKINLQPQQQFFGMHQELSRKEQLVIKPFVPEEFSKSFLPNEEFDNILTMSINQAIYKNVLVGGDYLENNSHMNQMKHSHQLQQPQHQMAGNNVNFGNERNILNGIDLFNFPKAPENSHQAPNCYVDSAQPSSSQRSVPLYKRQAVFKNENNSFNGNMF